MFIKGSSKPIFFNHKSIDHLAKKSKGKVYNCSDVVYLDCMIFLFPESI